jgi:hypothetical protein
MQEFLKFLKENKEIKNVVILSGAGISTNAGIQDYRSYFPARAQSESRNHVQQSKSHFIINPIVFVLSLIHLNSPLSLLRLLDLLGPACLQPPLGYPLLLMWSRDVVGMYTTAVVTLNLAIGVSR